MGYALVIAGLLMIVTGARGTYAAFGKQLAGDFTGPGNFTYWMVGIGSVGALGYIKPLEQFSRWFMTLIIIAIFLADRGFFAKFTEALKTGPVAPTVPSAAPSGGAAQSPGAATGSVSPPRPDAAPGDIGRNYIDNLRPCRVAPWLFRDGCN